MADFFHLSDEQWVWIESLLPQDARGTPLVYDRRVLCVIVCASKLRRLSRARLRTEEDNLHPFPAPTWAQCLGAHLS